MSFANFSLRSAAALLCWFVAATLARADEAPPSGLRLSGFGTLGYVHSNERQADFSAGVFTPGAAGASGAWSADVDSRLGLQADWLLAPQWSAVVQLVSERSLLNGYAPQVEWANLKYQLSPDLNLRLGRIALPLLLVGDYRKAGYALPWVRPPVELYAAIPLTSSDGIDASYRWASGDISHVTQLFYGHADRGIQPQLRAKAQAMTGLSHTASSGPLTLRLSAMTMRVSANLATTLFEGLRQSGASGAALAQRYALDNSRTGALALGLSYDSCEWFVNAEAGSLISHSLLGHRSAAYLSGGLRYGDWTPYLSYAAAWANSATSTSGPEMLRRDAASLAAAARMNGGLNYLLSSVPHQHSVTAGLRWDVASSSAIKLQYERLMPVSDSRGTLINTQPEFRSGHAIGVLSVAVDFVF